MPLLAELTRNTRPTDVYTLVPHRGHVLWEPVLFRHCSSRAAWDVYRKCMECDGDSCSDWRVYHDAADKLYMYLRQRDIPLNGAVATTPILLRGQPGDDPPFRRAESHLALYVRLDFAPDRQAALEFAEGGETLLECGAMLIASGFRRQRIRGPGCILAFAVDLPHVARADALRSPALQQDSVLDAVVFAAATALPLNDPLPPPDVLIGKIEWMNTRYRRHYRHELCPTVRRFLVAAEDPASATPEEIERIRSYGYNAEGGASQELRHGMPALTGEQCARLRQFAEDHMTSVTADSVDDFPEYQVNLTGQVLSELVGAVTAEALLRLPELIGAPFGIPADRIYSAIHYILRVYSTETRPYIAFHSDTSQYTVNIALTSGGECDGGELLAVVGDRLAAIPKQMGCAVVHSSQLVHGVTRTVSGARYSLILFFTKRAQEGEFQLQ